jgi:hypothetical protein
MAGRLYTVVMTAGVMPLGSVMDLVELNPDSAKPIRIRRIRLGQTTESAVEEEQLAIAIIRGHSISGVGNAVTPRPLATGVAPAGFTVETETASIATGGSPVILYEDCWNTRSGHDVAFSDEEAPGSVNERLVVRQSATADNLTMYATFWIEELG